MAESSDSGHSRTYRTAPTHHSEPSPKQHDSVAPATPVLHSFDYAAETPGAPPLQSFEMTDELGVPLISREPLNITNKSSCTLVEKRLKPTSSTYIYVHPQYGALFAHLATPSNTLPEAALTEGVPTHADAEPAVELERPSSRHSRHSRHQPPSFPGAQRKATAYIDTPPQSPPHSETELPDSPAFHHDDRGRSGPHSARISTSQPSSRSNSRDKSSLRHALHGTGDAWLAGPGLATGWQQDGSGNEAGRSHELPRSLTRHGRNHSSAGTTTSRSTSRSSRKWLTAYGTPCLNHANLPRLCRVCSHSAT